MIKLAHPIIDDDDKRAVVDALESGQLAQGPRVAAFEQAFAAYVGVPHAIAVNSGTAALHVALLAHGIGPGDDVIVPAFSFAASANAVLHAGARPIFADVRTDDFGLDPALAEAAITPATKAIIAVHLYGQTCDITAIAEICVRRGLVLIEDAAQAVGATHAVGNSHRAAGSFGTGCFSFYATKNLQTGEGGMITTSDEHVATLARTLRSQGERTRYVTEELGYNFRMTEVAAALGLSQLPKLDARNDQRRANAARLNSLLAPNERIITPRELPGRRHVYHQYTVRVSAGREARDQLQSALRARDIESAIFYPTPIHHQPLYQRLGLGTGDYPIAKQLAEEVLSLPVHPSLSNESLEMIAGAVSEASA